MACAVTGAGTPGPIEAASATLVSWLAEVAGPAVQEPPSDADDGAAGLAVWPLELLPDQQGSAASAGRPLRLRVRHLVTGKGGAAQAVRLLDQALVAAAAGNGAPEVAFAPVAPEVWLALGARPRPALLFDVTAQVARPAAVGPRVRAPLQVQDGSLRAISGRVLGPEDVPLAGIRLEVSGTGASTYSGTGGAFALPGVPARVPLRLLLSGRGVRRLADVPADAAADDIVIRFDLEEG